MSAVTDPLAWVQHAEEGFMMVRLYKLIRRAFID